MLALRSDSENGALIQRPWSAPDRARSAV